MKLVLFLVVIIFSQAWGTEEEDAMDELAEITMQEIARRMKSSMSYERLHSFKRKKMYNSAFANDQTRVDMHMEALRADGSPVSCSAAVDLRDNSGPPTLSSYSCQEQKRSGFSRRSGETPCNPEEREEMASKAKELINRSIQDENDMLHMPGMMDMPELQQSPITIKGVIECHRVEIDEEGNIEYKLKMKAVKDGVPEVCDVSIVKLPNGDVNMDQNQCQGSN